MPIQIIYRFTCDIHQCPTSVETSFQYCPDLPKPNIPIPWKWNYIKNILICPEHDIKEKLFIDGKEI